MPCAAETYLSPFHAIHVGKRRTTNGAPSIRRSRRSQSPQPQPEAVSALWIRLRSSVLQQKHGEELPWVWVPGEETIMTRTIIFHGENKQQYKGFVHEGEGLWQNVIRGWPMNTETDPYKDPDIWKELDLTVPLPSTLFKICSIRDGKVWAAPYNGSACFWIEGEVHDLPDNLKQILERQRDQARY